MRLQSTLTPEIFLKHQEYFESSLITLLEKQQSKIDSLNETMAIKSATIYKYRATITTLRFKYKDLSVVVYNLKNQLKEKTTDTDKIINDLDKEIHKINKRIDDELQQSYIDNNKLHDENQKLKKEIERLRKENSKFMKEVNKDSSNSSFPPSTDMFKEPVNMRKPSSKSRGGQPGHQVHRSVLTDTPTTIITKTVRDAPSGATPVLDGEGNVSYYRTQEIDAKFITTITETRYFIKEDGDTVEDTIMNTYKINSVSYSIPFKSKVLYLNSKGAIALQRLCTILNELSDNQIHIRPSTITKWSKEFYERSQPVIAALISEALGSEVLHVDETGWKINGKRAWIHTLCNSNIAYFTCTPTRAGKVTGPIKILSEYTGILVHDHFKSYYKLEECEHAECNAHILRYLKSGVDFDESTDCAKLLSLLQQMNRHKKKLIAKGEGEIPEEEYQKYKKEYIEIIDTTLTKFNEQNPNIDKKYIPDYIRTMKRMKVYVEEHLRFLRDFKVPFDNNRAELQMRPTKTKKKVSGQSITIETANYFCAIHTINQTCILQNKNTLKTIEDILNNRTPSIVSLC